MTTVSSSLEFKLEAAAHSTALISPLMAALRARVLLLCLTFGLVSGRLWQCARGRTAIAAAGKRTTKSTSNADDQMMTLLDTAEVLGFIDLFEHQQAAAAPKPLSIAAAVVHGTNGLTNDLNVRVMSQLRTWLADAGQMAFAQMDTTERGLSMMAHSMARLLHDQGRHAEARLLLEEALSVRRETLGLCHPDTLSTLNNLGALLRHQGRHDEARAMVEKTLINCREQFQQPHQHPPSAPRSTDLSLLLPNHGQLEEGQPMAEEARMIHTALVASVGHGELNVHVLAQLRTWLADAARMALARMDATERGMSVMAHSTARLLYDQGRYDEVRLLLEETLAVRRELLGAHHPDTLSTMNNLGLLQERQAGASQARGPAH